MPMENTPKNKGSQAESDIQQVATNPPPSEAPDALSKRKRPLPWFIRPGAIMQSQVVMAILGISPRTWRKWKKEGLQTIEGFGARAELVETDAVFDFLRSRKKETTTA